LAFARCFVAYPSCQPAFLLSKTAVAKIEINFHSAQKCSDLIPG
jgi:hypothetical protein